MTEFGPDAIRQLREIARRVLREEIGQTGGTPPPPRDMLRVNVFLSTGGITARSSNNVGMGTGTLYRKSSTSSALTATTRTDTIYNLSTTAVTAGAQAYLLAQQDTAGIFWVTVAPCTT